MFFMLATYRYKNGGIAFQLLYKAGGEGHAVCENGMG